MNHHSGGSNQVVSEAVSVIQGEQLHIKKARRSKAYRATFGCGLLVFAARELSFSGLLVHLVVIPLLQRSLILVVAVLLSVFCLGKGLIRRLLLDSCHLI